MAKTSSAPMTPEIAELAFDLCERQKIPITEALQQLGYSKHSLKKVLNSECLRMVQLRAYEEAGGSNELESQVLVASLQASHTKQVKEEGKMVEKTYPDHQTRLAGLDRVFELKGLGSRRSRRDRGEEADARPILNFPRAARIQVVVVQEAKADAGQGPGRQE